MGRRGRTATRPVRGERDRDELVLAYLDVPPQAVGSLWWNMSAVRSMGWDDAVQVARLGLLRAASLWTEGGGGFRAYAFVSCRNRVRTEVRRGVMVGPKQGRWDRVPKVEWLRERMEEEGRIVRVPAPPFSDDPMEPSSRWLRLLAAMPDGLEKKYLEARVSGLTCFEAAASCGWSGHHWETLNHRAINLARKVGKEIGL